MTSRITPLEAPFAPDTETRLQAMTPPGVPPIALFRTFVRNAPMAEAMRGWGSYALGRALSLSMREREIVIDRTCALCKCEYEWGVHVAFFAERVGLGAAQITSLTHGDARDACWTDARERLLITAVDALHADATVSDPLFAALRDAFDEAQLLDLFMLCGWYHAISFCANAAGVPHEASAPRFDDYPAHDGRAN